MRPQTKRIARFGLLTAMMLILGLLDRAIPLGSLLGGALPGVKLGLANTVLIYAVYWMSPASAALLLTAKILLSGFIFGSLSAIIYSLAGGVLSLALMLVLRGRSMRPWRIILTSVGGAMAHNLGQVLAAALMLRTPGLLAVYLPPLLLIGAGVGALTGTVAWRVMKALKPGDFIKNGEKG